MPFRGENSDRKTHPINDHGAGFLFNKISGVPDTHCSCIHIPWAPSLIPNQEFRCWSMMLHCPIRETRVSGGTMCISVYMLMAEFVMKSISSGRFVGSPKCTDMESAQKILKQQHCRKRDYRDSFDNVRTFVKESRASQVTQVRNLRRGESVGEHMSAILGMVAEFLSGESFLGRRIDIQLWHQHILQHNPFSIFTRDTNVQTNIIRYFAPYLVKDIGAHILYSEFKDENQWRYCEIRSELSKGLKFGGLVPQWRKIPRIIWQFFPYLHGVCDPFQKLGGLWIYQFWNHLPHQGSSPPSWNSWICWHKSYKFRYILPSVSSKKR